MNPNRVIRSGAGLSFSAIPGIEEPAVSVCGRYIRVSRALLGTPRLL
jgi:hypothetical protein